MSKIEEVMVSKLTVKTIEADGSDGKKEKTHIARFYGVAKGIKTTDRDGEILFGLTGDFVGINVTDKSRKYKSGVLYMPGGINEMLCSAVDTGVLDDKDRPVYSEIKFAVDVYAKPATNKIGYQYECVPVIDTVQSDAMVELEQALPALGE